MRARMRALQIKAVRTLICVGKICVGVGDESRHRARTRHANMRTGRVPILLPRIDIQMYAGVPVCVYLCPRAANISLAVQRAHHRTPARVSLHFTQHTRAYACVAFCTRTQRTISFRAHTHEAAALVRTEINTNKCQKICTRVPRSRIRPSIVLAVAAAAECAAALLTHYTADTNQDGLIGFGINCRTNSLWRRKCLLAGHRFAYAPLITVLCTPPVHRAGETHNSAAAAVHKGSIICEFDCCVHPRGRTPACGRRVRFAKLKIISQSPVRSLRSNAQNAEPICLTQSNDLANPGTTELINRSAIAG